VSISKRLQRQIHTAVFGGKSSVKGAASGTASSVAFTPLQGLEIVNPMAAEKRTQEGNKYFSNTASFRSAKTS
jgi:U4/U6 small nuclear ribonucleoprotein PRP31